MTSRNQEIAWKKYLQSQGRQLGQASEAVLLSESSSRAEVVMIVEDAQRESAELQAQLKGQIHRLTGD